MGRGRIDVYMDIGKLNQGLLSLELTYLPTYLV